MRMVARNWKLKKEGEGEKDFIYLFIFVSFKYTRLLGAIEIFR